MSTEIPKFACDAMLGSLSRWLRAAGYDSFWQEGIDDGELVLLSQREDRILISCDTGIFKRGLVRDGVVSSLQLPNSLGTQEQLQRVMEHFQLFVREPRCMACSGEIREVPKELVQDKVPERTYERIDQFWQCTQCEQPFWQGTHWTAISEVLDSFTQ
ncbi:MAG: Mut7-C RNAse domain-containing protein [Gemmataceae bacterium]